MDPFPAGQPAERVCLPFARAFSHRKTAARMVAAAGIRKLEGGQDGNPAEPVRVAEELEAGLDGLRPAGAGFVRLEVKARPAASDGFQLDRKRPRIVRMQEPLHDQDAAEKLFGSPTVSEDEAERGLKEGAFEVVAETEDFQMDQMLADPRVPDFHVELRERVQVLALDPAGQRPAQERVDEILAVLHHHLFAGRIARVQDEPCRRQDPGPHKNPPRLEARGSASPQIGRVDGHLAAGLFEPLDALAVDVFYLSVAPQVGERVRGRVNQTVGTPVEAQPAIDAARTAVAPAGEDRLPRTPEPDVPGAALLEILHETFHLARKPERLGLLRIRRQDVFEPVRRTRAGRQPIENRPVVRDEILVGKRPVRDIVPMDRQERRAPDAAQPSPRQRVVKRACPAVGLHRIPVVTVRVVGSVKELQMDVAVALFLLAAQHRQVGGIPSGRRLPGHPVKNLLPRRLQCAARIQHGHPLPARQQRLHAGHRRRSGPEHKITVVHSPPIRGQMPPEVNCG